MSLEASSIIHTISVRQFEPVLMGEHIIRYLCPNSNIRDNL